ncbi:MAG: CAP domain-containing protein, partial [Gammaproteobacteria bacterium]|nr:CAP domain-containing protein [Gammaproteobacteria bacterium]
MASQPVGLFQVDIHNRENVRNFYNSVYNASNDIPVDWHGDVSECNAGDSSTTHQNATLRRINFFRAMTGIPSWITFSEAANTKARSAALLASANNALSHYPPASWGCYTPAAAQASASSNIALGVTGPDAITAYIEDAGQHNHSVGHRRWLLYPQTRVMGTGDIQPGSGAGRNASAINVFDDQYGRIRPQTRDEFVSWPPAGYTPYQLVFPRWSFAIPHADFSQAQVAVIHNGQRLNLTVYPPQQGYGENTLVWEMHEQLATPGLDRTYQVLISNVLINRRIRRSFNYTVTVFDSARQGSDTRLQVIDGNQQIPLQDTSHYTFGATPEVNQYQVLKAIVSDYHAVFSAENGLSDMTVNHAGTSPVLSNYVANTGQKSYYLSHLAGRDEQLVFDKQFLANDQSLLEFYSRISCAMTDEVARVQVSVDDGSSWIDVYEQPGVRFGLRESEFSLKTVDLSQFAGQIIRVRINYTFSSGWRCTTSNSGWYLDDIQFRNVQVLNNPQITTVTRTAFQFTPTQTGDYVLASRPILFNGFAGQWSEAFAVSVQGNLNTDTNNPDPMTTPVQVSNPGIA